MISYRSLLFIATAMNDSGITFYSFYNYDRNQIRKLDKDLLLDKSIQASETLYYNYTLDIG